MRAAGGGARAWQFPKRNDRWGLLAWEDPLAKDGPAAPFWADAPMLEAESAGGGAPGLAGLLEGAGARLAGLRLLDGALILKIERGRSAVQLRIADGDGFDPDGGLVLRLGLGLDLPVALARARDLWAIAGARGKAQGLPPGAGKAKACAARAPTATSRPSTGRCCAAPCAGNRRATARAVSRGGAAARGAHARACMRRDSDHRAAWARMARRAGRVPGHLPHEPAGGADVPGAACAWRALRASIPPLEGGARATDRPRGRERRRNP